MSDRLEQSTPVGWSMQGLAIARNNIAPGPVVLLDTDFENDTANLQYVDDAFLDTYQPDYVDGEHILGIDSGGILGIDSGGILGIDSGGIDADTVVDMSGGWTALYTLAETSAVHISMRYNISLDYTHETDEYAQVLVGVDETLLGEDGKAYVARVVGGTGESSDESTGWRTFNTTLTLSPGAHEFRFGVFHNKKTTETETARLMLDRIQILVSPVQASE